MTTDARILMIDDELKWRQNFARYIPGDVHHDSAATAKEAAERLRRIYYDLVLLDLSMDVGDSSNRDNRPIQQYLSTKPDGTRYFIISGHIMPRETIDAAYRLGANFVFFKGDMDPGEFADKTAAAIAEAANHRAEAISVARQKLLPDQILEYQVFEPLKTGAINGYPILESLFRTLAPIGQHLDRRHFVISGNSALALFWSRRKGKAVSTILVHESVPDDSALSSLAEWLGFATRGPSVVDTTSHHVRIRVFDEPTISDEHFELPVINIAAR